MKVAFVAIASLTTYHSRGNKEHRTHVIRPFLIAAFAAIAAPPSGTIAQETPWHTLAAQYITIHYQDGLEDDARLLKSFAEQAGDAMLDEFADHKPADLLQAAECNIYIYAKANEKASESMALAETGVRNGKYFADFHFLAPSAHSKDARTSAGEPKDEHYFFKLVVHEYSTVVLERLTTIKPAGWRLFSGPSWFVQGYEEYLGLTRSSEHARKVTLPKYRAMLTANPNRISFDFGVNVESPYVDGAVLLAFMHESYGKEKVQAILLSNKPTFGAAVREALGDDLSGFAAKFAKWQAQTP